MSNFHSLLLTAALALGGAAFVGCDDATDTTDTTGTPQSTGGATDPAGTEMDPAVSDPTTPGGTATDPATTPPTTRPSGTTQGTGTSGTTGTGASTPTGTSGAGTSGNDPDTLR